MRLFLGIDLPDEIKIKIDKKIQSLKKEYPHFRWVPWENFHVTLYFFGEKNNLQKIKEKIEKIVWDQPLFYLYSLNIDIFANNKLVIYLNFRREKKIEKLAELIKSTFEDFKKNKDKRKFVPHLTLARGGRSSKQQYFALKRKIAKIKIDASFLVDKIILFESKLNNDRPVYKKLAFFNLQNI